MNLPKFLRKPTLSNEERFALAQKEGGTIGDYIKIGDTYYFFNALGKLVKSADLTREEVSFLHDRARKTFLIAKRTPQGPWG